MEQEEKYYDMKHHSLGHCFIYYCDTFADINNKPVPSTIAGLPDPSKIRDLLAEIGYKSPSVIRNPTRDQILKDLQACKFCVFLFKQVHVFLLTIRRYNT